MALTKDDLQAIGSVIDERVPAIIDERVPSIVKKEIDERVPAIVKKEVDNAIETQVRPLVKEEVNGAIEKQVRPLFEAQNKFIARGFADLKETYVSRDELDEKISELQTDLQTEIDALRTEVNTLKQRRASV